MPLIHAVASNCCSYVQLASRQNPHVPTAADCAGPCVCHCHASKHDGQGVEAVRVGASGAAREPVRCLISRPSDGALACSEMSFSVRAGCVRCLTGERGEGGLPGPSRKLRVTLRARRSRAVHTAMAWPELPGQQGLLLSVRPTLYGLDHSRTDSAATQPATQRHLTQRHIVQHSRRGLAPCMAGS